MLSIFPKYQSDLVAYRVTCIQEPRSLLLHLAREALANFEWNCPGGRTMHHMTCLSVTLSRALTPEGGTHYSCPSDYSCSPDGPQTPLIHAPSLCDGAYDFARPALVWRLLCLLHTKAIIPPYVFEDRR